MPESPEVRTFTDQLQKYAGAMLGGINIMPTGKFMKTDLPNQLSNLTFPLFNSSFHCKGKQLYWSFNRDVHFLINLGMTGSFSETQTKHTALAFHFTNSILYFNDIRHFGNVRVVNGVQLQEKLDSLGWDPLCQPYTKPVTLDSEDPNKKLREFIHVKLWDKPKKTVAEVLLDQSGFAGLGNYLRSEILYATKISPHRLCADLKTSEVEKIMIAYQDIVKQSYQMGGASLATYADMNGNKGNFTTAMKVYGKILDPLGNKVEKMTAKDGRTVHWVPGVQI